MNRISPIRPGKGDTPEARALKESLLATQSELKDAFAAFDRAVDPDLTESCIYTIRALQARMDYLVKRIKEQEGSAAAAAVRPGRGVLL